MYKRSTAGSGIKITNLVWMKALLTSKLQMVGMQGMMDNAQPSQQMHVDFPGQSLLQTCKSNKLFLLKIYEINCVGRWLIKDRLPGSVV